MTIPVTFESVNSAVADGLENRSLLFRQWIQSTEASSALQPAATKLGVSEGLLREELNFALNMAWLDGYYRANVSELERLRQANAEMAQFLPNPHKSELLGGAK